MYIIEYLVYSEFPLFLDESLLTKIVIIIMY